MRARRQYNSRLKYGSDKRGSAAIHTATIHEQPPEAAHRVPNTWLLWVIVAEFAILFGPTALWLWNRWTASVWTDAHGLIIFPVAVYLLWTEIQRHSDRPRETSPWGFVILIPCLALHALDTGLHTQLLSAFALFAALPGLSLIFLGATRTKAALFPMVFLFFTLPIPLVLTESFQLFLREIATIGTAYLIPKLGIPLFVEGFVLHMPKGSLLVADACSGFSTLYASLAIAVLTAYWCPRPARRVAVLLAAAPIAIGVNVLRIVILALLVQFWGVDILATSLHEISGMVTFAVALPLIFWIGHAPATSAE